MKKIINTDRAPAPVGPYSQAVIHGNTLYISGQIAIDPESGNLITSSIEDETHQVMRNIGNVLLEAGIGWDDVIKCSVFVADMGDYEKINAIYGEYFDDQTAPVRELVQVACLPKSVNIEISVIAAIHS